MTKVFEVWAQYQKTHETHRVFVGCSVYNNISRPPYRDLIDEVYMEAKIHQAGSGSLEVGKNLAELVLNRFQFEENDYIDTIMDSVDSQLKIIDSRMNPRIYSICRIPVEARGYETKIWCVGGSNILKGFKERMKINNVV